MPHRTPGELCVHLRPRPRTPYFNVVRVFTACDATLLSLFCSFAAPPAPNFKVVWEGGLVDFFSRVYPWKLFDSEFLLQCIYNLDREIRSTLRSNIDFGGEGEGNVEFGEGGCQTEGSEE